MNEPNVVTETELKARAVAPRVTEKDLEANIESIHFINAADAAGRIDITSLNLLTICVIVLKSGFTVKGENACASPENYQQDIGERIALANAKSKIWPLMGYALKDHLAYGGHSYWSQPAEDQTEGVAQ